LVVSALGVVGLLLFVVVSCLGDVGLLLFVVASGLGVVGLLLLWLGEIRRGKGVGEVERSSENWFLALRVVVDNFGNLQIKVQSLC
jgi:hypothetical protein